MVYESNNKPLYAGLGGAVGGLALGLLIAKGCSTEAPTLESKVNVQVMHEGIPVDSGDVIRGRNRVEYPTTVTGNEVVINMYRVKSTSAKPSTGKAPATTGAAKAPVATKKTPAPGGTQYTGSKAPKTETPAQPTQPAKPADEEKEDGKAPGFNPL